MKKLNILSAVPTLISNAVGFALYPHISKIVEQKFRITRVSTAWIISPSGKMVVELPYFRAYRIHKKRFWGFSTAKPRIFWWEKILKHIRVIKYEQENFEALSTIVDMVPTIIFLGYMVSAVASLRKDLQLEYANDLRP